MKIASTTTRNLGNEQEQLTTRPRQSKAPRLVGPTDRVSLSQGLSTKSKLQVVAMAAGGSLLGAVPVLGVISHAAANFGNEKIGDTLGMGLAQAGFATNIIASLAMVASPYGAYALAVPAVLGAVSWGGYALETAKQKEG